MVKIKYLVIGLSLVCLVSLVAVLFIVWNKNKSSQIVQSKTNNESGSSSQVLSSSQNNQTSGLQVAQNSGVSTLGQIPQATSNSNNANVTDNSSSQALDPSTFGQYESHKNEQSALFKDLLVGDGDTLTANKKAAVLYKVWLTNGTLVDASKPNDKGELQPFVFTLGAHEVIAGWDQALGGMKVGGVRFLIVPPAVGYGATDKGNIPANSVLIFQVQLLAVK